MKSPIQKIIGKTIEKVVVTEATRDPREQVHLLFSDGTHFEVFGDNITVRITSNSAEKTELLSLLKRYDRTNIVVYRERGPNPDS